MFSDTKPRSGTRDSGGTEDCVEVIRVGRHARSATAVAGCTGGTKVQLGLSHVRCKGAHLHVFRCFHVLHDFKSDSSNDNTQRLAN
jgi:hypothetical protein